MKRIRRVLAWVAAAALVAASLTTVRAIAGTHRDARSGVEYHQLAYFRSGPSYSCYPPGSCSRGIGPAFDLTLPARPETYSGTLTVSFNFGTRGSATYEVEAVLLDASNRSVGAIHPPRRLLANSSAGNSRTVVFGLYGVPGGKPLQIQLSVILYKVRHYPISITLSSITEEIRLS